MRFDAVPWAVWILALGWIASMFAGLGDGWSVRKDWIVRWGFDPLLVRQVGIDGLVSDLSALAGRTISAQFVHLDWWHLLGNAAYVVVFGSQVERVVGPIGLILSALAIGALAYVIPAALDQQGMMVVAGSSGAVSGILGMYLVLCAKSSIGLWLPLGLVFQFIRIPAWALIVSWLAVQLIFASNASSYPTVAVESHIAGFVAGLVFGFVARRMVAQRRPLRKW